MIWRSALFILAGALLGFVFQRLVGCPTGGCPITSNPYVATIYGAVVGLAAAGGLR